MHHTSSELTFLGISTCCPWGSESPGSESPEVYSALDYFRRSLRCYSALCKKSFLLFVGFVTHSFKFSSSFLESQVYLALNQFL